MGKSKRSDAGRVQPNRPHFHNSGSSHSGSRTADDELLKKRQDGGRITGVAETNCHHVDHTEQFGVFRFVYKSVFSGRQMDGVIVGGYIRRNSEVARGAGDVRTRLNYDIGVRRAWVQYGHVSAVFPRSRNDVQYIRRAGNRAHTAQLGMAAVQKLRAGRGNRSRRPCETEHSLSIVHTACVLFRRHSEHSAENRRNAVQMDTDIRLAADQLCEFQLGNIRDIRGHIEWSGGNHRVNIGADTGVELHQAAF